MLILDAIEVARQAGKLIPAQRIAAWSGEPRVFLMCRPLYDEVENGKADQDEKVRQRWATLEAAMSHFIENGLVTDDLIKQLKPEKFEHWELKSRKPSLRVFLGGLQCLMYLLVPMSNCVLNSEECGRRNLREKNWFVKNTGKKLAYQMRSPHRRNTDMRII